MTDDEDSSDEHFTEPNNLIHEHYKYMSFRENMQEFPGRVPQRKRKKDPENPQQDSNKPKVRKIFCVTSRLGKKLTCNLPLARENKSWEVKSEGKKRKEKKTFTILTPKSLIIYFEIIIIACIEET